MGFFDLNIPYRESDRHVTDKPSLRGRRLKLALRAMELGYTGVAYNRTLKGVMSESDRCSIVLFPISKLTPSSSAFFASVKFHRDLLNVAITAPFRQYTRLTVVVDNPAQASALNSGNPVLRSYDIVAVRPTTQNAFDHACQTSEVDIIAIDFLKMSPLRLRQPMVKAAIKRGVYFEIIYSGLIADAESKRQLISNCKLLVDWTQGKNLIICSAAPSVTELRGPQDAANLFFLLGLTTECAKATISSNCRSLLAKGLRKKHFYKEAVKVEEIPSGGQSIPVKSMFDDWLKWDPISSGQGDVLLDDMEKPLASSKPVKENVKAINFTSNLNGLPSHGFQIKDLMHAARAALETPVADKLAPALMETEGDASDEKLEEKGGLDSLHEKQQSLLKNEGNRSNLSNDHGGVELPEGQMFNSDCLDSEVPLGHVPEVKTALLPLSRDNQVSGLEDSRLLSLPTFNVESADHEEMIQTSNDLEANHSDDSEQNIVASKTQSQDSHQGDCLHGGGQLHITEMNTLTTNNHVSEDLFNPLNNPSSSVSPLLPAVENVLEMGVGEHEGNTTNKLLNRKGIDIMREHPLADGSVDGGQANKMTDSSIKSGDELPLEESSNVIANFDEPIIDDVMTELKQMDSVTDYQGLVISQAGMNKRKGKSPHQPFLFPFKRALKPRPFKRKPRK